MFVKNILVGKRGNVVTIEPTADLTAAVKLLAERRIGAVVILGANHRIVGILSERDIVRALAAHGPTALNKPVGQCACALTQIKIRRDVAGTIRR